MPKLLSDNKNSVVKKDALIFLLLVAVVFTLAYGSLTDVCLWGDDFAAYILQGIAIAEGNFDYQTELNHFLHPSFMPDEAANDELVYVWGYSLAHALVYKLVGFDRVNFSSIVYYKLPSVFALALMAGVLYLFLRRRFSCTLSALLSLLFCLYSGFFEFFTSLYSDLFFLFFVVLSMYLWELFLSSLGRRRVILGIISGISLWFMYETRLNGISILFLCALAQIWPYFKRNERCVRFSDKKYLAAELLPYMVFILLKLVSEAILAPATSNASDLVGTNLGIIYGNMVHYFELLLTWYNAMYTNIISGVFSLGIIPDNGSTAVYKAVFYLQKFLAWFSVALCVIGILFDGIKKNFHYTAFIGLYYFISCMLFYNQGLRYIFPILPVLLMFTAYGAVRVCSLLSGKKDRSKKGRVLCAVLTFVLCFFAVCPQHLENQRLQALEGRDAAFATVAESSERNAYSSSALEAYNYVNENLSKDSVIGFFKPRALYLNTQIKSVVPLDLIGHSLEEVSHYLIFKHIIINPAPTEDFVTIWENEDFVLMEKRG